MFARTLALALPAVLTACTCSEPPAIHGHVVDLWAEPVEGMEVAIADVDASASTDAKGHVAVPMMATAELSLSREGYIPRSVTIEPASTDADVHETIEVIPEPQTPGFHLVGPKSYLPLPAEAVKRIGNELKTWQGVGSTGDVSVSGAPFRVVFHTPDLKLDEVARLDVELHRLVFVESTEVDTVEGKAEVDVNLWVSGGKVKVTREALGSDDNYLIRVDDDLPRGSYAFVSMDLLDSGASTYDEVAPAIRRVHVFSVE